MKISKCWHLLSVSYNVTLQCCLAAGVRTTWTAWGRQYPGSPGWTIPSSPRSRRQASTARGKYLVGSTLTPRLTVRPIMSVDQIPPELLQSPPYSAPTVARLRQTRSLSVLTISGTLYNQQYFVCDWWFNVDCSVVSMKEKKCRRAPIKPPFTRLPTSMESTKTSQEQLRRPMSFAEPETNNFTDWIEQRTWRYLI